MAELFAVLLLEFRIKYCSKVSVHCLSSNEFSISLLQNKLEGVLPSVLLRDHPYVPAQRVVALSSTARGFTASDKPDVEQ